MNPRLGIGLRARLVGAVLLLLVGLLATLATLVVVRSAQALEEIDELRAQAATNQLAESAATGVLARSSLLLEAPVDAFVRTPELLEVRVVDEAGATLIERRPSRATEVPLDERFTRRAPIRLEPAVPALEGGLGDLPPAFDPLADPLGGATGDPLSEPRETARPQHPPPGKQGDKASADAHRVDGGDVATEPPSEPTEGEIIGEVVATFGRAATARVQRRTRNDMVVAFVGLGALGLLLVLLLATSVVRRVRTLADAAAQVAGGDLDTRVDEEGGDELTELSHSFNQMAAALAAQRQRLQDAGDELAASESLAAIGRATAVIAHELKNPLGILLGAADIAQNDARPAAQRQKAAAIISDEVKRLDATLKQLLGYARPRAPERKPLSAAVLLAAAARRATLPGGPAESVEVELDGALATLLAADDRATPAPPSSSESTGATLPHERGVRGHERGADEGRTDEVLAEEVLADEVLAEEVLADEVLADEPQIAQVLLNLVTNAAQAGARRVMLSLQPPAGPGARTALIVDDDGPGVDDDVVARLFQPFVTTKQRGAGLGLAGSRRLCRDNGGDLRYDGPSPLGGARFVVTLAPAPVQPPIAPVRGKEEDA